MSHSISLYYDQWQRIMDALPPEARELETRIAAACENAREGEVAIEFSDEERRQLNRAYLPR